ncbi:type II secretion system protein GspC [Leclercia tamurae]|uniref:Type II secretion system protein GspC n=1 Tax=Leclercia tamurae TaxID=2926467 RepID=A0ABT2RFK2_9ENTR|nr:type II secretion system protein GspC [Leclercia tamurae]MCU6679622.1 type II secretion system protein GspC [Leclercia tamurae]
MFILLIFSGQQGYVVFKEYKKVSEKVSDPDNAMRGETAQDQDFALFQPAVYQDTPQRTVKTPLGAEVEGIINSDEAWMSFAVIKTPSGQQSYREGESLTGYSDAWIEEINRDNVVINYQGSPQTLAIKRPDYFKGDTSNSPTPRPVADAGSDNLHLNDYFVLKPWFDNGELEGYQIKPRNASTFFSHSGLQKGDVVVKVNAVDMTKEEQAKNIIASWSKMREAEVVVRRHAHLENIRVNVLNN